MIEATEDYTYDWSLYDAIYMAKIEALEQEMFENRYVAPLFDLDLVDEDGEYFLV